MPNFSMNDFRLDGKVALVTGASDGIGFAIACGLANAGATIIFNGRSQEKNEAAEARYRENGVCAKGYVCDVTDEKQVQELVKKIEDEYGAVDILVNNAAIIKRIPMIEMDVEDFRKVIDTDLTAAFICSKAAIPGMIKKGHGKIINICSMMSELGRETVSAYAAAKGGLKMLTRNICSEYGSANIQCNGIGPGYIATKQTAPLRERPRETLFNASRGQIPLPWLGSTDALPPSHSHGDPTSLAPHERLTDLAVVPREKPRTGAAAREQPRDSPVIER